MLYKRKIEIMLEIVDIIELVEVKLIVCDWIGCLWVFVFEFYFCF